MLPTASSELDYCLCPTLCRSVLFLVLSSRALRGLNSATVWVLLFPTQCCLGAVMAVRLALNAVHCVVSIPSLPGFPYSLLCAVPSHPKFCAYYLSLHTVAECRTVWALLFATHCCFGALKLCAGGQCCPLRCLNSATAWASSIPYSVLLWRIQSRHLALNTALRRLDCHARVIATLRCPCAFKFGHSAAATLSKLHHRLALSADQRMYCILSPMLGP